MSKTNISSHFCKEFIFCDLQAQSKQQAIEVLIDSIVQKHAQAFAPLSTDEVKHDVFKRESTHTTGLGEGLAFPHARIKGFSKFVVALGIFPHGIAFDSVDQKPVKLLCLLISSQEEPYLILQTMSWLIQFAQSSAQLTESLSTLTEEQIFQKLQSYDANQAPALKGTVTAKELMRPLKTTVNMEDSIEKVIEIMHLKRIEVLPVLDDKHELQGEISCYDLFEYGLPDFFKQLHTVAFIKHFDPFEKYFKFQKKLKAKDLLNPQCVVIDEQTTLMEVIFLLSIKDHQRLFVTDQQKLVGVIDRFSILDKVLFF